MKADHTLEIFKEAILLEKRGESFYKKVAEQAENPTVAEFFETMANEEHKHAQILTEQFRAYSHNKKFAPGSFDDADTSQVLSKVLTQTLKEKISAAGYEAAAISAAISMEEQAIKLYSKSAETSDDPEAKALYAWLSRWEREHLNALLDIDKAVKDKIWFDNKFWPF
jgi:rubrerythrin